MMHQFEPLTVLAPHFAMVTIEPSSSSDASDNHKTKSQSDSTPGQVYAPVEEDGTGEA